MLLERYVRERRLDGNRCSSKRTRDRDEVDEDSKIAFLEHNPTQDILDAFRGKGVGVEELEVRRSRASVETLVTGPSHEL